MNSLGTRAAEPGHPPGFGQAPPPVLAQPSGGHHVESWNQSPSSEAALKAGDIRKTASTGTPDLEGDTDQEAVRKPQTKSRAFGLVSLYSVECAGRSYSAG